MGEQGSFLTLHRTRHWTHSRHPLHRICVPYGENLHFAVICLPADVLHDQVCSVQIKVFVILLTCRKKTSETSKKRSTMLFCHAALFTT